MVYYCTYLLPTNYEKWFKVKNVSFWVSTSYVNKNLWTVFNVPRLMEKRISAELEYKALLQPLLRE